MVLQILHSTALPWGSDAHDLRMPHVACCLDTKTLPRYMPATFIAPRGTAYLLAAAKLATAQQLAAIAAASTSSSNSSAAQPHLVSGDTAAESGGGWLTGSAAAGFADAALAALPKLLDDAVLLRELLAKWDARLCGLQEAAEAESKVCNVQHQFSHHRFFVVGAQLQSH